MSRWYAAVQVCASMGRVYSTEEIRRGRLPDTEAHTKLGQRLLALCHYVTGAEFPVIGAMVHGSTARDEATVRSDVDFLAVVPDGITPQEFQEYVSVMHDEAWMHRVTVEPIVMTESEAEAGDHTIDILFLDYLAGAEKEARHFVVKQPGIESLTGLITPCETNPLSALRSYIIHKKEKFTKTSDDDEEINFRDMQRALELPKAFSRRFMQALGVTPSQVSRELDYQLTTLSNLDKEYSQLLADTLIQKRNLTYYAEAIAEMRYEAHSAALTASLEAFATVKELVKE